jgi:hypothetical protein
LLYSMVFLLTAVSCTLTSTLLNWSRPLYESLVRIAVKEILPGREILSLNSFS